MTCETVTLPNGGAAIVCGRGLRPIKCTTCGKPGDLLCDWKVPSRKSGTCDNPICAKCATSPERGKDLCPGHALAFEAWKAKRA